VAAAGLTRSVDENRFLFLDEYRRGLLATRLYPGTEDAPDSAIAAWRPHQQAQT
jgi:hypothetical protein